MYVHIHIRTIKHQPTNKYKDIFVGIKSKLTWDTRLRTDLKETICIQKLGNPEERRIRLP